MRLFYILGLLLFCAGASAKVVYKSTQADGSVVYSDTPVSGSTAVKLSAMNNVIVPALNNATSKKPSTTQAIKKVKPQTSYLVSILSPSDEESIRINSGDISIRSNISPKRAGKFQLVMDNRVIRTQAKSLFELKSVARGAHSIQVNFIGNSGKILASSKQQTFYLHKASALIHAN